MTTSTSLAARDCREHRAGLRSSAPIKWVAVALAAGAATLMMTATPATAAAIPNPQTGCVGGNNMMTAPGMSTQGWWTLPDSNPGLGPSSDGMVKAMMVSDPYWPIMCVTG